MRLRIILATRSCVKTLGSVLDAAVARGHELDICMRPRAHRERVLTTDFQRWESNADPKATPDAIISVRLEDFVCDEGPGLRVVVPYFAEFLMRPVTDYDDTLLCYPSEELRIQHCGLAPVTGWTIADHAAMYDHRDPAWTMPNPKHVFFTAKRNVPGKKGYWWYLTTTLLDRASAHRRGLRWIVKTREKHKDPWWMRALADTYWGEAAMYPHISHPLLCGAASMSHFTSGAVAEAVLHNVPTLWYRTADHRHHLKTHQRQSDTYLQPWLMSKETYVKRFIGWDDGHNGARVIEAIEKRVK